MAQAKKKTTAINQAASKESKQPGTPDKNTTRAADETDGADHSIINKKIRTEESTQTSDNETTLDVALKDTPKPTAKAGKRSARAIKESESKQAKIERKQSSPSTGTTAKTVQPIRTRLERRSKAYKKSYQGLDTDKRYNLQEASQVIGNTNPVKFDASVELHVRLAVDPRQADQNIRDSVILPSGNGKTIRVAAFVEEDDIAAAKAAGADLVGEAAIIKELEGGNFSFDILVATPNQMPKLGRYARLLGPKGLMPNPKSGTVTTDVTKAIAESKAGKVEYRVDSGGIIHIAVGKASFKPAQLIENLQAVMTSIQANKPASIKTAYIVSAHLTTTMGPSIQLIV